MADTAAFLRELQNATRYEGQVVHCEHLDPRPGCYGHLDRPLPEPLRQALRDGGIENFYSHQAQAINAARDGRDLVVSTNTASGKTLCYNVPVLEALMEKPSRRALYLFPTKALAQDQLRGVTALARPVLHSFAAATFDGDTPTHERSQIKKKGQIVLTNPDMLHFGILPNHSSWSSFLRHLKFVVVDEMHAYRGVFGSHVANVLRRLQRLCAQYGSHPQFICCSATIANPGEHAMRLLGRPVTVIDKDGSPRGAKDFVFWNPPLVDQSLNVRRSANGEAAALLASLVRRGIRNITFVKTRRLAELVYMYARDSLAAQHPELSAKIRSYRAGYLAEDRRQIERELLDGSLIGVTATNALELGVDIGDLDATIVTGYPGTIASTWQQAGRSGRHTEHSLSVLIAMNNPLDQYLMRHPEAFFGQGHEHALIAPANPYILRDHLLCAAYENPLTAADGRLFGPEWESARDALVEEGYLHQRGNAWCLSAQVRYPADTVNIRSTSEQRFLLVDDSQHRELETIDAATAFFQVYPGAIYLHQGETYLVKDLDLATRVAHAVPVKASYYTQTMEREDLQIIDVQRQRQIGAVLACIGRVRVTTQVIAYRKKRQFTDEVFGIEDLDLPPQTFDTVGLWFDVPASLLARVEREGGDIAGALHATEHGMIGLLPLFAMCDRQDIGGLSTPYFAETRRPQVFIYDAHPGGIGIAEQGFTLLESLWRATWRALAECPCEDGCPSCVQSPKCGSNNEPLDKRAAIHILGAICGQE